MSVSFLTLLSRVLGLLRDIVIAAVFPVGIRTDAFFAAFKIPNMMRRLTAEGAFTQAFVPVYNACREHEGEQAASEIRDTMAGWLTLLLAAITLAGVVAAPLLIDVLAPGFARVEGKAELASELLRITFPYILLISLTAFGGAILNSHGRFAAFAFVPALLNLSMIGSALWLAPRMQDPIEALAWGVVIGGALQLAWQVAAMLRYGQLPRLRLPRLSAPARRIFKLTAQGALGVSIAQLGLIVSLVFASFIAQGSVTWLYFADRIMELPVGIIGAALAVIALPTLSKQAAAQDVAAYSKTIDWSLRIALLFGVPAALAMAALALPIAATFFQHGAYTPHDSEQTALAIAAYGVGVPALVTVRILAAGFYSHQNVMTPVRTAAVALAVTIALNFLLVGILRHAGLALAISLGATVNTLILATLLIRRGLYRALPGWLLFGARLAAGCLAMLAVVFALAGEHGEWTQLDFATRIWRLAGCVVLGAAAYFAILLASGMRLAHLRPPAG